MPEPANPGPVTPSMPPAFDSMAWGSQLEAALCSHCDWLYLIPANGTGLTCPHCFSGTLTLLDSVAQLTGFDHPPELLLPFTVSESAVRQSVQHFAANIWFAPVDLSPANLQNRLQRLYLPLWLVDTQVEATWQAETGFDYNVVSHRDAYDEQGDGWTSEEVEETRIRWEPRIGNLARMYHNIPAPALEEYSTLRRQLGDYDLSSGQPFNSEFIAHSLIRLPNRSVTDAWPDALPALQSKSAEECRQAAQANHIREFRWSATYKKQTWSLFLLPLYATYYVDDDQHPQPILIHGQTGRLTGPARASMKRAWRVAWIIVAVAVVLFGLSLIAGLASLLLPPLLIIAILGLFGAVVIGALAVLPLGIAWNFNRGESNS